MKLLLNLIKLHENNLLLAWNGLMIYEMLAFIATIHDCKRLIHNYIRSISESSVTLFKIYSDFDVKRLIDHFLISGRIEIY